MRVAGKRLACTFAHQLACTFARQLACTFASKISGAVGNNTWSAQKSGVQKHTPGDHHESAVNKDSLFGVYFCTPAGVHFCTPNFWRGREKK